MENISTYELILKTTEGNRNAILTIPAKYDPNLLTVESCVLFIQSQGVKISDQGNQRLQSAIAQWKQQSPSEDVKVEVAQAVLPIHGKDATIKWLHQALSAQVATATTEGNIDHYEQSAFKLINQGELLGEMIAPTPGEDGIDVKGMSIAAKPGKPLATRIHESIELRDGNKLYAAIDGIFQLKDGVVLINPVLDVSSQVDFSTGNIDFKGDVVIRHGVKDRFKVKATGDIKINGLVEDAIIDAGGDLDTYRGIVFRQSGSITVGGNLRTSHLNNVKGGIRGSLNLDREMINCQLTIGDKLYSPNGSVIGGDNNISGSIKVSKLGSTAGVPTIIRIGDLPLLTEKLKQFKEDQQILAEKLKKIVGMMERLDQARILSPEQKELATDLFYQKYECEAEIESMQMQIDELENELASSNNVDITVNKTIFNGVILKLKDQCYKVNEPISGPVQIGRNSGGENIIKHHNGKEYQIHKLMRHYDLNTGKIL